MNDTDRLLLRADAGVRIGTGHVMRSLAIAEAHRMRGGDAWFAVGPGAQSMLGAIRTRGFKLARVTAAPGSHGDCDAVISIARSIGARACVLDGYRFSSDYAGALTDDGIQVAAVDDLGRDLPVDIIVDPNYAAARRGCARVELTGPRFAPLRTEFLSYPSGIRLSESRSLRVVISFGGSDPNGGTTRILRAMAKTRPFTAVVVIGPGCKDLPDLLAAARDAAYSGHTVELVRAPQNMARVLSTADAAICAAGSVLWELSYFGCPTLAFTVADNQRAAALLARDGYILSGESIAALTQDDIAERIELLTGNSATRSHLSEVFASLVDGQGAARVLDALHTA